MSAREKLHAVCIEAERELPWKDLAAFIDGLNEEYQHFLTLINNRQIGRGVPKSRRPNVPASPLPGKDAE